MTALTMKNRILEVTFCGNFRVIDLHACVHMCSPTHVHMCLPTHMCSECAEDEHDSLLEHGTMMFLSGPHHGQLLQVSCLVSFDLRVKRLETRPLESRPVPGLSTYTDACWTTCMHACMHAAYMPHALAHTHSHAHTHLPTHTFQNM